MELTELSSLPHVTKLAGKLGRHRAFGNRKIGLLLENIVEDYLFLNKFQQIKGIFCTHETIGVEPFFFLNFYAFLCRHLKSKKLLPMRTVTTSYIKIIAFDDLRRL